MDSRGGSGSGTLIVGEDSRVHINSRGSSGSGTIVVGDDSHVHINSRGGSGSGTIVVGDDSHVHINSRGGSGSGTIVVGDHAEVRINSGGSVAGRLVVGDAATLHVASNEPGAFSVDATSKLYVGCDFDARRLAGGVAAPTCETAAQPRGRRKDLAPDAKFLEDVGSTPKPAEYTDPRLEVMRALLEHLDRNHDAKARHDEHGSKWHRHDHDRSSDSRTADAAEPGAESAKRRGSRKLAA